MTPPKKALPNDTAQNVKRIHKYGCVFLSSGSPVPFAQPLPK